jgi:hypothetical protein
MYIDSSTLTAAADSLAGLLFGTLEGPGFQDHHDQVRQKWLQTPQLTLLARLHKVKCNAFAGDITISVHCCPSFHLKHGNVDLFRAFKTELLIDQHDV